MTDSQEVATNEAATNEVPLQEKPKRKDVLVIDPRMIDAPDDENNRFQDHSEEDILEMVHDFMTEGQLSPVVVRHDRSTGRYKLVAGYRRHKAAMHIVTVDGQEFGLQAIAKRINDEEACILNLRENDNRVALSPMDRAFAIRRFKDVFGKTDAEIAEIFKRTQAWVSQQKKLLDLSPDLQTKVHNGELSVNAAQTISELPEEQQNEAVADATDGDGKVNTDAAKKKVRKARQSKGKGLDRSRAEIRKARKEIIEDPRLPAPVRSVVEAFDNFDRGQIEREVMVDVVIELYKMTPSEEDGVIHSEDDITDAINNVVGETEAAETETASA